MCRRNGKAVSGLGTLGWEGNKQRLDVLGSAWESETSLLCGFLAPSLPRVDFRAICGVGVEGWGRYLLSFIQEQTFRRAGWLLLAEGWVRTSETVNLGLINYLKVCMGPRLC